AQFDPFGGDDVAPVDGERQAALFAIGRLKVLVQPPEFIDPADVGLPPIVHRNRPSMTAPLLTRRSARPGHCSQAGASDSHSRAGPSRSVSRTLLQSPHA